MSSLSGTCVAWRVLVRVPDFPISSTTHQDELASDPIAYQSHLTPEQTHRQSPSDLHEEEQESPDPSVRRDCDTILRSATSHESMGSFHTSIKFFGSAK